MKYNFEACTNKLHDILLGCICPLTNPVNRHSINAICSKDFSNRGIIHTNLGDAISASCSTYIKVSIACEP